MSGLVLEVCILATKIIIIAGMRQGWLSLGPHHCTLHPLCSLALAHLRLTRLCLGVCVPRSLWS